MRAKSRLEREWAAQVLYTLVSDTPQRIARGAKMRKEIIERIQKGKKPYGYRFKWVNSSAKKMVAMLADIARDFDEQHPADHAALDDLLDILATTIQILKDAKPDADPEELGTETGLEA